MFTGVFVIFFVICAENGHTTTEFKFFFAQDESDNEAKLRFYRTFEDYTEVPFTNATKMLSASGFDTSRCTVFFCHGFTGYPNGPAVTALMNAYLEQNQCNVILLNWDKLAAQIYGSLAVSYLRWALPNSFKVASEFADTLLRLSEAGLNLNNTHLVGHSLGGQIMGMAGNKLTQNGVVLPWITGLDPAGVIFDIKLPFERLNPKSALFVDVIHTDPSKYGSKKSLGTVDFWPNYKSIGHVMQPGCEADSQVSFTDNDLCNHNKAWQYLVDTMKNPGTFLGSYAKSYRTWKNYSPEQRKANVLEFGKFEPNATLGNCYFTTASASPYGFGEKGL